MKTNYSPGPWRYEDVNGCKDIFSEAFKHAIAEIDHSTDDGVAFTSGLENDDEDLANAKLIAAAPELLESLKDLIEWANIKDGSPSQYLRDKALSAIKKATE